MEERPEAMLLRRRITFMILDFTKPNPNFLDWKQRIWPTPQKREEKRENTLSLYSSSAFDSITRITDNGKINPKKINIIGKINNLIEIQN